MLGLIAKPWPMTVAKVVVLPSPAFPAANMTNNDYGRTAVWVNNGADDGLAVIFDLGFVAPVDVLAVLWHTVVGGIRYVAYRDASFSQSSVLYDSGFTSSTTGSTLRDNLALYKHLITLPSPVFARYWCVETGRKGAGYNTQISRAFIGLGAKFAIGAQKAALSARDMNAKVTTEIGEERSQEDHRLIRPIVSLSLEYAKQSEMEQVLGQYTLGLGTSKPLLVCTDLTSQFLQDNIAFGRPDKVIALESSIYDVWSFEAVVPSLGV